MSIVFYLHTGVMERKKERMRADVEACKLVSSTGVRRLRLPGRCQRKSRRNLEPRILGSSHVSPEFDLFCLRSCDGQRFYSVWLLF